MQNLHLNLHFLFFLYSIPVDKTHEVPLCPFPFNK